MNEQPERSSYGRLLWRYLRPQAARVVLLALLIVGGITLQLINPQLVRRFLDATERGRDLGYLWRTASLFTALALLAQVLRLAVTYVGEQVAWTATNDLRADLALHCLRLDMSFHKRYKPGELIERVDGDVNALANFFSQLVIQLTSNLILVVGVIGLLWIVDRRVGLTVAVIASAGLVVMRWVNGRVVPRWQEVRQVSSDLFGYLEEWLDGTEEIQTSGATQYVMYRLYELLRDRWRANQGAQRINLALMSLPIILPALAYVAAYLWGGLLFRGELLTVGGVYVLFYYIGIIHDPLWAIQRQVQDLQRAAASMNRIIALFEEESTLAEGSGLLLAPGPLSVTLDGVSFYYNDDPETDILRNIHLSLAPGKVLGILGRTGSGKSTLIRLLLRFYDPTSGAVYLGDELEQVDLRDLSQDVLRDRVGMVTQEVQIFYATVRDNLTLFDDNIADEQILKALDDLGLRPWLDSLPHGLETQLEGGQALSAGEAQLLALGRLFLADAGLVILDEASSRLDPATERLLENALDRLLSGRTAIIIAHRLATVQRADEIMILADGEVVEHGERAALASDPSSRFHHLLQVGLEDAAVRNG